MSMKFLVSLIESESGYPNSVYTKLIISWTMLRKKCVFAIKLV